MDISPLSRQFDIRLEKLNQEIHDGLEKVRRHLQELEEVEQNAHPDKVGRTFAELLENSMDEQEPPASEDLKTPVPE